MLRLPVLLWLGCAMLMAQIPAATTGRLDLEVGTRDRKPVGGARVIWAGPDKQLHEDRTGADGQLHLSGLAPGVYGLKISAPGYTVAIAPATVAYVLAGNVAVVNAVMIPNGTIRGTVTGDDGKPIPGAVIALARPSGRGAQSGVEAAVTGADGQYQGDLPGGNWVAKAYLPLQRSIELGRGFEPAYSASFNLRPGATQNIDFRLRSSPTFHIRGRIAAGKPEAEGAFILIQDCSPGADTDSGARVPLARDGSLDVPALLPGTYCLTLETAQGTGVKHLSEAAIATITDRDVEGLEITPRP